MMISHERIIQWMNVIREDVGLPSQYRLLENFWGSQLYSKEWMISQLVPHLSSVDTVYIFGGWHGILAQLIIDAYPDIRIFSIDKDPQCSVVGSRLKFPVDNIQFITCDMQDFSQYTTNTKIVINSSTEHVEQHVFDRWFENVPAESIVALQGNNFFECLEHIRCTNTLDEFNTLNPLKNYLYSGTMLCQGPNNQYTRFMTIGYK